MQEKYSKRDLLDLKDRNIQALLIEDDPEDTMLLMNVMAKPGWPSLKFTLLCADDLKSGLQILDQGGIEVVLLDLMLPDSKGIETITKVRSKAPDVPVVVLTGMQDEEIGLEAIRHGAQDYQVKGNIHGHSLKRTLSFAVERHRMLTGLKNIINGAKDGMLVTDTQGTIYYANPSAESFFNQTAQELIGKACPYPLPSIGSGEVKIPGKEGGERTVEMRLSEIEWQDKPALLISIRDITDLRRIEQLKAEVRERQRMDKLKDELMSAVSHEMRSPLTVIRAISSDLLEESRQSDDKEQVHIIEMQYKNVIRLQNILDKILDLSRLESGKALIRLQRLDILPVVRETVDGFRLLAKENNLAIESDFPSKMPFVSADPDLFVQVLNNLIDNAMRFAKSKIILRIHEGAASQESPGRKGHRGERGTPVMTKSIQISVIDDGPGIPKARIPELFNKFVQINRSNQSDKYRGTGLGLAICKEIIGQHNGQIWVESNEGQGAQFHVVLPQCTEEKDTATGGKNGKES